MAEENRAQRPGDVRIKKLRIISSSGDSFRLEHMYQTIDIFEDIYEDCVTGAIFIADSLNLIGKAPLVGNEKIEIEIITPSLENEDALKVEGRIYKISDRGPLGDGQIGYVLHFSSPEKIYSTGLKISKAYKTKLLSDIAEQVYKDYLEPVRNKKIVVEPTTFTRSVLVPSWTPFFTLNWLAKGAKSDKHGGANYVFFERRDAFVFVSMETLFSTPPLASYFYGIKNMADAKENKMTADFYNAESYKFISSPDSIAGLQRGMFSGKLISNDLVNRKIDTKYFNYADTFDDFSHLNKSKLTNNEILGDFVTSHVTLLPKQLNAFGEDDEGNHLDEVIMERKSQFQQLNSVMAEVVVPGNTGRAVGDVVTFSFPAYEASGGEDVAPSADKYLTGKYLITALRHTIAALENSPNHTMTMELSTDSFSSKLPDPGWTG